MVRVFNTNKKDIDGTVAFMLAPPFTISVIICAIEVILLRI